MPSLRYAVVPLRAVLVALFALVVVFQVLSFPGELAQMAEESPEDADLRWPLLVVIELVLVCVQVVLVSTWQLLTQVARDRIFSVRSFRWVDAIMAAVAVAWCLFAGIFVFVGVRADDPGPILLLGSVLLGGAVLALLVVVLRALLHQATALRSDMDAVI